MIEKGYKRERVDKTLFIKYLNPGNMISQIYVDNVVFGSTSLMCVQEFVNQMKNEFEMILTGKLTYFLGFQAKQLENGIFISQSKYAKNLVKKFGLDLAKHMRTPMSTNLRLTKDESSSGVDPSLYRSIIGSLHYFTANRLDTCFSFSVCIRHQVNPKESY